MSRRTSGAAMLAGALGILGGLAAVGLLASSSRPRRHPLGKGVFVRSPRHAGDPGNFAAWLDWLGLSWCTILVLWQKSPTAEIEYHLEELPTYAEAARSVGVECWVWGWPRPESEARERFVAKVSEAARSAGAHGVILNVEEPFYLPRFALEARALMTELRAALGWAPVGLASYGGGPPMHPAFPWAPFAELCDFGLPQIYDTHHTLGEDYPRQSIRAWHEAGFDRLVPVWGASAAHTPEQMGDIAGRTPVPDGAVCWWDLHHIVASRGRAQFVRDFIVPPAYAAAA